MKKILIVLFLLFNQFVYAQNRQIYGKVTDDKGENLPGVLVLLKGTTIGTMTDEEGTFKISFEDFNKPKLVFSWIGLKTKEIALSDTISLPLMVSLEQQDDNEEEKINYPLNSLYLAVGLEHSELTFNNFSELSSKEIELLNGLIISDINIGISGYKNNIYSGLIFGYDTGFYIEDSIKTSVTKYKYTVPLGYGFHSKNHFVVITPFFSVSRNSYRFLIYNENKKTTLSNYFQTKYVNLNFIQYTSSLGGNIDIRLFRLKDYYNYYPFYLSVGAGYFMKLSKFPKIKSPNHTLTSLEIIHTGKLFLQAGIKLYISHIRF